MIGRDADQPGSIGGGGLRWATAVFFVVAAVAFQVGCTAGADLQLGGPDDAGILTQRFDTAVYSYEGVNDLSVLLVAGDDERIDRAVHLRMFWKPRAGRTPLGGLSTNCVVRYIDFRHDSAAVYGGAGLLLPRSSPGAEQMKGLLKNVTINLADAGTGIEVSGDVTIASADFTAALDAIAFNRWLRRVGAQLRDRLGQPRFVVHDLVQPPG